MLCMVILLLYYTHGCMKPADTCRKINNNIKKFNLPEWMARKVSVPNHQVSRAVPSLRTSHVKLEYGYPYLVPGTGAGITIHRISGNRDIGWSGLEMIPARCVLWQRVVRRVQPTTARVPYPKFTPLILSVFDRFDFHKVHLKTKVLHN